MKNKIHFPPLHKEPSFKQKGDPTILPSFVIGLLIRCNFFYNKIRSLHLFNFFEETLVLEGENVALVGEDAVGPEAFHSSFDDD